MKAPPAQPQADWTIDTLLDAYPGAARILTRHGMACIGCAMASFETLAEAAREYGLHLPSFLKELQAAGCSPPRRVARK